MPELLLGQGVGEGHMVAQTEGPDPMPMRLEGLSPRAFLLREMQEDLAAEFALARALSERESEEEEQGEEDVEGLA